MEIKVKMVELKKYKFEYRGMSSLRAFSGTSVASIFRLGVQLQRFPNQIIPPKGKLQIEDLKEDIKSVVLGEPVLENRENTL